MASRLADKNALITASTLTSTNALMLRQIATLINAQNATLSPAHKLKIRVRQAAMLMLEITQSQFSRLSIIRCGTYSIWTMMSKTAWTSATTTALTHSCKHARISYIQRQQAVSYHRAVQVTWNTYDEHLDTDLSKHRNLDSQDNSNVQVGNRLDVRNASIDDDLDLSRDLNNHIDVDFECSTGGQSVCWAVKLSI